MKLRPYQKKAIELLNGSIAFGTKIPVTYLHTGLGKEQPYSEFVLTENGYKKVGDVRIGEYLINRYGEKTKVLQIFEQGIKDVYELYFTDGTKVRCGLDHLWVIKGKYVGSKETVKSLKDMIDTINIKTYDKKYKKYYNNRYYKVPLCKPIKFSKKELKIEPKLMGILLGDGSFRNGIISISNSNKKIIDYINKELNKVGCKIGNLKTSNNGNKIDFNVINKIRKKEKTFIYKKIEEYKLIDKYSSEKFIPKDYLFGSKLQRFKLLRGLLLTDGYRAFKGIYEYSTSSEQLAKDIEFLVRSLGIYVNIKSRIPKYTYKGVKKEGKKNYRIYINFNKKYKTIGKVEKVGKEKSRCFLVEKEDHTYITSNFTVTHNTAVIGTICKEEYSNDKTILVLVSRIILAKQLANTIYNITSIKPTLLQGSNSTSGSNKIIVSTWQSINARLDVISFEPDIVLIDEFHMFYNGDIYNKVINRLKPDIIIGLTATPYNAEGKWLVNKNDIIEPITMIEAIEQKYSTPIEYYFLSTTQNIYNKSNEINKKYITEEDAYILAQKHTKNCILETHNRFGLNKHKSLIFATNIKHCEEIIKYCKQIKLNAEIIHSKMSDKAVEQNINMFKNGMINILISVDKISVGFDVPDITLALDLRATKSKVRYIQAIGRLVRIAPNKDKAIWIDAVGNVKRFGFHYEPHFSPDELNDKTNTKALKFREKLSIIENINNIKEPIDEELVQIEIKKYEELKSKKLQDMTLNELMNYYDSFTYFNSNIEELLKVGSLIYSKIINKISSNTLSWIQSNIYSELSFTKHLSKYQIDTINKIVFNAYKTRIKNIIKNRKKFASLAYFISWLTENNELLKMYKNIASDNIEVSKDNYININKDEIPF